MPRLAVIPQDGDAAVVVAIDDIEVPIAVQVAVGGAKTHGPLIEAPVGADVLELEAPEIAHGNVPFRPDRTLRHDPDGFGHAFGALLALHDVDVGIVRESIR